MAQVIDYDYIEEISTLDAGRNLASDTTNWYTQDLPGVNTFLINAEAQAYNFPEWWGWTWIAWWSTNVSWSSSSYNSISWTSWKVFLPDWTEINISSWSASLSATTYIYVDQQTWTTYYTTSAADSVWDNKILLCVAAPTESWKSCAFQAFWTNAQSTFITADNIAANTIATNQLIWNTITWRTIQTGSSWERFVMSPSEVAQYDSNWRKRVSYTGNWITFYDTNWVTASSIYWYNNMEIAIDGALYVTWQIESPVWDITWLACDTFTVRDDATINWETWAKGYLRIPVWINKYRQ